MKSHGHAAGPQRKTPEYKVWLTMVHKSGHRYRGRVAMCARWRESFEAFFADMGRKPPGTRLERLDKAGDFELANCVWAPWPRRRRQAT
jgi:hypothetical protein